MKVEIVEPSNYLVERLVDLLGEDRRDEAKDLVYDYHKVLREQIMSQGQTIMEDVLTRGIR
jgi:hypothetical protein